MKKENIILVIGVVLVSVLAFGAGLLCSGRYQIQTVTTNVFGLPSSTVTRKSCIKIDRLTGRAWVVEGVNARGDTEHIHFREIPKK